jgi:hypothetical protein
MSDRSMFMAPLGSTTHRGRKIRKALSLSEPLILGVPFGKKK